MSALVKATRSSFSSRWLTTTGVYRCSLRARHAAVKELLTDEHKLYRLAFAESNVDRKWDRVIFTDESTFTSANDVRF